MVTVNTVKIELVNQNKKPTIRYRTNYRHISVLIDTGANIPIYFGSIDTFLLDFPDAVESSWITFVCGLGGEEKTPCQIYTIPQFSFIDSKNRQKQFTVYHMPIAIYDTGRNFGYHMIIGYTAFSKVDCSFKNRPAKPYMQITFDRDVGGTVQLCYDETGKVYEIDGKAVVDYMITLFQKPKTLSEKMNTVNVKSEKNYIKAFQRLYNEKRRKNK